MENTTTNDLTHQAPQALIDDQLYAQIGATTDQVRQAMQEGVAYVLEALAREVRSLYPNADGVRIYDDPSTGRGLDRIFVCGRTVACTPAGLSDVVAKVWTPDDLTEAENFDLMTYFARQLVWFGRVTDESKVFSLPVERVNRARPLPELAVQVTA